MNKAKERIKKATTLFWTSTRHEKTEGGIIKKTATYNKKKLKTRIEKIDAFLEKKKM